jgi:RNA polymerase sigma-70 factor (ECF subfamily)
MSSANQPETPDQGRDGWFSTTHWSVILAAGNDDSPEAQEALEKLCQTYWYPLYAYVRKQGRNPHDAQDLTQEFFARLLARDFLQGVSPAKGKFRSFLLVSLKNFLANDWARLQTAKRGGGEVPLSLDAEEAECRYQLDPASGLSPEKLYDRRWAIGLLEQAFAVLKSEFVSEDKARLFSHLKVFLEDEADSGDYAGVAGSLGMTPNSVAVKVHRLRQRYRELVRAEVSKTVATPDQVDEEVRELFAALASN